MNETRFDNKLSSTGPVFKPLYKQVEEHVKQLIVEQRWKPAEMLPNEFQLAAEMNVSQGTIRKALNSLTDNKILIRKQGVGTFVSEDTAQNSLFRFFPIIADGKTPELPKAELLSIEVHMPKPMIAAALELSSKDKIIEMRRRRILNNEYCIAESIYLPHSHFKSLLNMSDIPHTLYHFYQTHFNFTVHSTKDAIKADIANASDVELLKATLGDPILSVQRTTRALNGKAMEFRISRCRSDKYHYLVELN
jgi:GntR family transcriptional regulator